MSAGRPAETVVVLLCGEDDALSDALVRIRDATRVRDVEREVGCARIRVAPGSLDRVREAVGTEVRMVPPLVEDT